MTDRLLLTNAIQPESALNAAPLLYPQCELPDGSTLTRVDLLEESSLVYKLNWSGVGELVVTGPLLAKASHLLSGLKSGGVPRSLEKPLVFTHWIDPVSISRM